MSFKTTLGAAIAAGTISLGSIALADTPSGNTADDKALVTLTSGALQTQGMAMILSNAM